MRHHHSTRTLGRERNQRTALLRSLARALVLHRAIRTTETKAKELRPFIERLVTKSKTDSIQTRRFVSARLGGDEEAMTALVNDIAPSYRERPGGYTRITKLGPVGGDAARMARIEFV